MCITGLAVDEPRSPRSSRLPSSTDPGASSIVGIRPRHTHLLSTSSSWIHSCPNHHLTHGFPPFLFFLGGVTAAKSTSATSTKRLGGSGGGALKGEVARVIHPFRWRETTRRIQTRRATTGEWGGKIKLQTNSIQEEVRGLEEVLTNAVLCPRNLRTWALSSRLVLGSTRSVRAGYACAQFDSPGRSTTMCRPHSS